MSDPNCQASNPRAGPGTPIAFAGLSCATGRVGLFAGRVHRGHH